ncbi:MAG TPA: electron transfer flavoprotein subunit alpha/FixB family protein [Ktedonobacteraceae bacterium]|nr:electron transfer flavoprotein subunit alpha/FixB family protein [Ktedonobacteraceae bacterium]
MLELHGNALEEHGSELLATLVELAHRQPEAAVVRAVLLAAPGTPLPDLASVGALGIEHVYVLAHPRLARYATEAWVSALAWLVRERAPLLVASGATANGRDWMPRLAARLQLPYAPGCLSIDVQGDALYALRPIYEGRAYVQTRASLKGRSALATLLMDTRGNPVAMEESSQGHQSPLVTTFTPVIEASNMAEQVQQVAIQAPSPEEVELEEAERIVAGGRGVGQEGFARVAAFARMLGAAVGATRVSTDRGWVEHARQIGATGKSVHPRLYIACGISGAAQHTSGMREAQTIIAINPDRTAPIFALADLGLLGDANQVVPLAAKLIAKD